jgi:acetyl-CoA synthetase
MPENEAGDALENLLHENRKFPPSEDFAANAIATAALYQEAAADRLGFWAKQSRELLSWEPGRSNRPWTGPKPPFAKWFVGGEINAAYNALDRHVEAGNGDRVAMLLGGRAGRHPHEYTYAQLTDAVKKAANVLFEAFGVASGRPRRDLPADDPGSRRFRCWPVARIGAIHSVVFGGFSCRQRCATGSTTPSAKLVITADGTYRRGAPSPAQASRGSAALEADGPHRAARSS